MSRSIELRPILNRTPLGAYRWKVVLACWLIAVLDGFDIQSMAFVAPALAPLWNIPKAISTNAEASPPVNRAATGWD